MDERYFGKNCPEGMVQIEFVGCDPSDKHSEYGWKPTKSAFVEIYVDGKRFRINVGNLDDGKRGIKVVTNSEIELGRTAINSVTIFYKE